jgi:glycosyltransferase involved in cell wall biosynthesis
VTIIVPKFQTPAKPKKQKILVLCDHILSVSGVGTQALALFTGLIETGRYKVVSLGGAIKHSNYQVMQPHPDILIKPTDGFGTKEQLRHLLLTEKPDLLFLFTDPRQFFWTWEMEDEIRQICPIAYWHVWDNGPYPEFNRVWYESTDLINCLSHKTYELVKPHFVNKTNYIPHTFSKQQYHPIDPKELAGITSEQFAGREDWYKILWVNRNAHRKVPADVINCFSDFLDNLEAKHGHRKALLILHTDPYGQEGPNLEEVVNHLGINENVIFSVEKLQIAQMNVLHNMCDVLVNIAKNEGFGLSTLINMMVGKPIIALCTGGMTRQVIDYRDGSENGVAIKPVVTQLMGSQPVPYIYEDYASHEQVANAFMKIYELTPHEKEKMKAKVLEYCEHEFKYENMISEWDRTIQKTITEFKNKKNRKAWEVQTIENKNYQKPKTQAEITAEVLKQNNIVIPDDVRALPINLTGYLMKNIVLTEVRS